MNAEFYDVYRNVRNKYRMATNEDVEDALAEARIALWLSKRRGQTIRCVRAFATCVAQRYVWSAMRRRTKYQYPDGDDCGAWSNLEATVSQLMVYPEHQNHLDAQTVLHESPAHYAEVLRRHYLEGETLEQIAQDIGATAACVRKRHERALNWARKHFKSDKESFKKK
ncbi:MAG: sigma-70 family RNA polymerase sigma factor [Bradyrhizobiaceae bacterium]|nr:sigma-70 family RNA polymerase sigma factor [Bradyrhizobiaceae bacterium]